MTQQADMEQVSSHRVMAGRHGQEMDGQVRKPHANHQGANDRGHGPRSHKPHDGTQKKHYKKGFHNGKKRPFKKKPKGPYRPDKETLFFVYGRFMLRDETAKRDGKPGYFVHGKVYRWYLDQSLVERGLIPRVGDRISCVIDNPKFKYMESSNMVVCVGVERVDSMKYSDFQKLLAIVPNTEPNKPVTRIIDFRPPITAVSKTLPDLDESLKSLGKYRDTGGFIHDIPKSGKIPKMQKHDWLNDLPQAGTNAISRDEIYMLKHNRWVDAHPAQAEIEGAARLESLDDVSSYRAQVKRDLRRRRQEHEQALGEIAVLEREAAQADAAAKEEARKQAVKQAAEKRAAARKAARAKARAEARAKMRAEMD